jgi:hypothetical protein
MLYWTILVIKNNLIKGNDVGKIFISRCTIVFVYSKCGVYFVGLKICGSTSLGSKVRDSVFLLE